jgi:hypothetical protein
MRRNQPANLFLFLLKSYRLKYWSLTAGNSHLWRHGMKYGCLWPERSRVGRVERLYRETRHYDTADAGNVAFRGEAAQRQPTILMGV